MSPESFELRQIGVVRSPLDDLDAAPKQGAEGGEEAWVDLDPAFLEALDDVRVGDHLIVLTWMHLGDRGTLKVHPRDDVSNPLRGVFSTRSASRPNPIGLHEVEVLEVDGTHLRVAPLEAIDGTPVVDLKPVI
jgi:tRNA-Thr(GGU) m(6)t(6)A37 methyltransferase TsaA